MKTNKLLFIILSKIILIFDAGLLRKQEETTNKIFIDKQIAHVQKNRILSKQNNNYPLVDVDIAMEKMLEVYKKIKQNTKELDVLFNAADFDQDGVVGFYEFICLYKYIEEKENDKQSLKQAEKIFFSKCDALNKESGDKSLSIEAFNSICTLFGFFNQEQVQKFCKNNIQSSDCQNYEQLKLNYHDIFQQIKMRFYKAGVYATIFSKGVNTLTQLIKNSPTEVQQKQSIWITYRILELESKKAILYFEISECLPTQFSDLIIKSKENDPDEGDSYWPIEFSNNLNWI